MDRLHVLDVQVCVNLGRADGRVAQHFLDRSEVGAAAEKVRGEGVAQVVG